MKLGSKLGNNKIEMIFKLQVLNVNALPTINIHTWKNCSQTIPTFPGICSKGNVFLSIWD